MKGRLESLSLRAGWFARARGRVWAHSYSGVWSASKLLCVWQEQLVVPGQFLFGLRDSFLPSDDEGQGEGPEFSRCRQDPGCLRRNPSVGAPTSVQT